MASSISGESTTSSDYKMTLGSSSTQYDVEYISTTTKANASSPTDLWVKFVVATGNPTTPPSPSSVQTLMSNKSINATRTTRVISTEAHTGYNTFSDISISSEGTGSNKKWYATVHLEA